MNYDRYSVSERHKQPLLDFVLSGLSQAGCRVLKCSRANQAPFRIAFEDPSGQRYGILVYAFFANSKPTKNRPEDEHRFQIKYGTKDGQLHQIWQDPFQLYTTLMVGIDTERDIFIGIDPVLHEFTKFFISVEFKRADVEAILDAGWHCWERSRPSLIECKNVLRRPLKDGTPKVDFQKTRASKNDPCSRFYRPSDFEILAACLHPLTESWEFAYRLTGEMDLHTKKCPEHLNNNVKISDEWDRDASTAFGRLLD